MERILMRLLFMAPGCLAGAVGFLLLARPRRRRLARRGLESPLPREAALLLLWSFSGGLAVLTLSPEPGWLYFGLGGDWTPYFDLAGAGSRVSLRPFHHLDDLHNLLGNIVMFVPFGFFAGLLRQTFSWKKALGLGLAITGGIECWQLLVGRYSDIDDVLLNTLGVLAGYWVWCLLARRAPGTAERFRLREGKGY